MFLFAMQHGLKKSCLFFNAAQPGVGGVQVLGSKHVQGTGFHQTSSSTVNRASGIHMKGNEGLGSSSQV